VDNREKARENRARRAAERRGLRLERSRRRDPQATGYGMYRLADAAVTSAVDDAERCDEWLTIGQVETRLSMPGARKDQLASSTSLPVIPETDLKIDVFRRDGLTAGSTVRVTHLPTGIVVTADSETSQLPSKAEALEKLRQLLQMRDGKEQESLLTNDEMLAVTLAGELYTHIQDHVCGNGSTRDDDLAELRTSIHHVQHWVMAQAAARAYPAEFRLMGEVIAVE
jgi:hypothetical protein